MDWLMVALGYVLRSVPLLGAAIAALVGVWFAIAAGTRATVGAWVLAVAFVVETWFVAAPSVQMGIQLSTNDAAALLLLSGLIFRFVFLGFPGRSRELVAWVALSTLVGCSLIFGLLAYGSKAGVEARPTVYFIVAGFYFACFHYAREDLLRLGRMFQWLAWAVAFVVAYRWLGLKLGFVSAQLVYTAGASSEFRVVGSDPTFLLAVAGCAHVVSWLGTSRMRSLLSAVVMLGLVLLLQHRSVWVATIGALIVIAWMNRPAVRKKALPISALLLVGLVSAVFLVLLNPDSRIAETLSRSVLSVTEARGTHVDRLSGWIELLHGYVNGGPRVWLLGHTFGSGYERWVLGQLREFSPHNFYVQLLLRVGALGVVLFIWVLIALHRRVLHVAAFGPDGERGRVAVLAALVAALLYFIPYQAFYLHGALYGVLIGALASPAHERVHHRWAIWRSDRQGATRWA